MAFFVSHKRPLIPLIISLFLLVFSPAGISFPWSQTSAAGIPINIAFLGDSLTNRPCEYDHAADGTLSNQQRPTGKNRNKNFGLLKKIEDGLGKHGGTIGDSTRVFAGDGQTIFDIVDGRTDPAGNHISSQLKRLQEAIQSGYKPDIVVLFWDSDISDFVRDNYAASNSTRRAFLESYKQKLQEFVMAIDALGIRLIIAGPGLLGEGWKLGLPKRFWGAEPVLDAARKVNQDVAITQDGNRVYLDVRTVLQKKSAGQFFYEGGVTLDGEHLNETGTQIFADTLVAELVRMFRLQGS